MTFQAGATIWIPCEVKPGPFSNERLIKLESRVGEWVGFVSIKCLRDEIESGTTEVLATIMDVEADSFRATIPGHALNSSAFHGSLARVTSSGAV